MYGNITRIVKRKGGAVQGARESGFSTVELLTTVCMLAVLISMAIPSYRDAVEKRRLTQGAELIAAFVSTIQSEAIKRNRPVAVSYVSGGNGDWCIGAVIGQAPCDCTESDSAAQAFCGLGGDPWVLRNTDVQAEHLIQSVGGDGAYVFDPIRGVFVDPNDVLQLDLGSASGAYRVNLSVIDTGKVSLCRPAAGEAIYGVEPCPEELLASD